MTNIELLEHRAIRQVNELIQTLGRLETAEGESRPDASDAWPRLQNIAHAKDVAVDCQEALLTAVNSTQPTEAP